MGGRIFFCLNSCRKALFTIISKKRTENLPKLCALSALPFLTKHGKINNVKRNKTLIN
uniref:Uncharacterized protein n=1 Tax=Dulem virus 37 TaxID=3145755 RepID=A0AAU8AW97_9CAUD